MNPTTTRAKYSHIEDPGKVLDDANKRAARRGRENTAQVRLRADEMRELQQAMHTLNLGSTSDALREGVRLLVREATEVAAAEQIEAFYQGEPAPLPDGVSLPTAAELAAMDEIEW